MKKLFLLLIFTAGLFINSIAQTNNEVLTMRNGFFGWVFRKGDQTLRAGEVANILSAHTEAAVRFSSARTNNTVATILGTVGGFMFGYTLGTSMGGGKANWGVGGAGAGIIATSIILSIKATSQARRAITLYNEGLKTGRLHRPDLKLQMTGNGLGLVVHF